MGKLKLMKIREKFGNPVPDNRIHYCAGCVTGKRAYEFGENMKSRFEIFTSPIAREIGAICGQCIYCRARGSKKTIDNYIPIEKIPCEKCGALKVNIGLYPNLIWKCEFCDLKMERKI